jgi:hypothetical protein
METTMACSDCGSKTIHRANCPKKVAAQKSAPRTAGAKAVPEKRRAAGAVRRELEGKTVRELVGFRAAHLQAVAEVDAELKMRQDELAAALGEEVKAA